MIVKKINVSNRIFGLDLMRTTAILMVLCSHILWIYPPQTGIISQLFTLFGFWGVEIFFVLSGFLIGKILYTMYVEDNFSYKSVFYFLQRRWFRTLPAYYLVLILNLIIALVLNVQVDGSLYYFFFLQNFYSTMLPFFPESWSLAVEEFAYLLTPFALLTGTLFLPSISKSKQFLYVVLSLILIFTITKIGYYLATSNTTLIEWNVSLKAVVIYRIDAILYGILASWIFINYPDTWKKIKIELAFLAFILIVIMYAGVGYFRILIDSYPFFWNVMYLPLTSIIFSLFLPILSQWNVTNIWILKPVTFISIISYSVYLLHYSVILQVMKYYFPTDSYSFNHLHFYTFLYLVITFLLSWILYRFYEKPMTNLRK